MPRNPNAEALRTFALGFPEAREDFPWGERVVKVKDKVFVFLGRDDADLGVTVKLPSSGLLALGLPFASPTGYGLGKSGWVTARFTAKDKPPLDMLRKWIEESYRAVAPKSLAAALDAPPKPAPRRIRYKKKRP
jgi:predicted DNA-binding protein (MmcQ/YjbR family)